MNDLSPANLPPTGPDAPWYDRPAEPTEPGMELYTAFLENRQVGEHLLKAHALRQLDPDTADFHHTEAMKHLSQLVQGLGMELLAVEEVKTR